MLCAWQGLREEVSNIIGARNMLHQELQLLDPILDPMKTHVDAFRKLGNHGALCQTDGALIIAQDERWGAEDSRGR